MVHENRREDADDQSFSLAVRRHGQAETDRTDGHGLVMRKEKYAKKIRRVVCASLIIPYCIVHLKK